jgi:cytidine deaminase
MEKEQLIRLAAEARHRARTFSGFHVGAALLTDTGEVVTGCNVEIASTRSSICAERTALVRAVALGFKNFTAIAVVSDASHPVSPCGFCRQYLIDFNPDMQVIMASADGNEVVEMAAHELLPMPFIVGEAE